MRPVTQTLKTPGFVCGIGGFATLALAWMTGNALAFVIGYTLLFVIAIHWILARLSIQNLEIALKPLGERARAFDPFPIEARLRNRSAWLPIVSPKVRVVETGRNREYTLRFPRTLFPGQSAKRVFHLPFCRRGKQQLRVVEAYSDFPVGLTRASRKLATATDTIQIWPEFIHPPVELFRVQEYQRISEREAVRQSTPDTIDPNRLRDYRPGDSLRRINWKLSAKTSKLIVADVPQTTQSFIWFVLNTHPSHWRRPVDFENGMRLVTAAMEFGFGRRILAGIVINQSRISVRSQRDLERTLDQVSDLGMDLSADPHIPVLAKGEFLVCSGRKGVSFIDASNWRIAV